LQWKSPKCRLAGFKSLGVAGGTSCSRIDVRDTWRLSGGAGKMGRAWWEVSRKSLTCTAAKWTATETGKRQA